jgi:acetylornithine deacetylase/succinyl-diaminopimelate desuccinylase-like protein
MKIPIRILTAFATLAVASSAAAQAPSAKQQLEYDIYRELVEIRTVHPDGDNTAAARAMARRLLDAGFDAKDVEVIAPVPLKGNLVARLRGTGELRPLLLLAHIDVVEAKKEDWSEGLDPFKLTERDGYYYGRGTIDDKSMAAGFVSALIRMKREGFKPKRDIIVALTADEETGTHNGVAWLLANRRDAIDADLALNEGGGGVLRHGKPFAQGVQVSEKMYLSFDFEATSAGGHSSVPGKHNAIYELAAALDRLSRFDLPLRLSTFTRLYFGRLGNIETGELGEAIAALGTNTATEAQIARVSQEPRYNAQLRTTCVATRLEGGHADNALPQRARATVNCRLMPREDPEFVQAELQRIAGDRVTVTAHGKVRVSDPSDPESPVMKTIQRVSDAMWPGTPVMPVMSSGATDGSRLRNAGIPVYGASGIFMEMGEVRIHGRDERVTVRALHEGFEFMYRLSRALALGE